MDIGRLKAVVDTTSIDQAADKFEKMGKAGEKAASKTKTVGDALKMLSGQGGIVGEVASKISSVGDEAAGAATGVRALAAALGGAGAAAAVLAPLLVLVAGAAGIVAAIRFAGTIDDLGDMATRVGMNVTQFAILKQQLEAAGTSVEALLGAKQKLANALAKVDDEGSKAAEALGRLGINVAEGADANDVATEIARKYSEQLGQGTVSTQTMADLQIVLGKNYLEAMQAMDEAAKAQDRYNSFQAAGIGISKEGSEAAGDFERAQNDIGVVLTAVGSKLVGEVVPAFTALIDQFVSSYKNGGLVKVAFDGIRVAVQLVMAPIRAAIHAFMTLDTMVTILGKSIGAVFAAIATKSIQPFRDLKDEAGQMLVDLQKRIGQVGAASWDSGEIDTKTPPKVTATTGGGKDKKDNKDKGTAVDLSYMSMQGITDAGAVERYQRQIAERDKRAAEALDELARKYKNLIDPVQEYRVQLEEIDKLEKEGKLNAAEALEARFQIQSKIQDAMDKTVQKADETKDILTRIGETAFQGFENALVNLVTTGRVNFRSLVASILSDIARLIIQIQIIEPMMKRFKEAMQANNTSGGGWAGLFTSIVGAFVGSANGNVFGSTGILKSANGNVFDSPTLHGYSGGIGMLGEAGPEAIMPLKRNSNGQLGVVAQGGNRTVVPTVTNQISVSIGSVDSADRKDELMRELKQTIRQETNAGIYEAMRRGNALNPVR